MYFSKRWHYSVFADGSVRLFIFQVCVIDVLFMFSITANGLQSRSVYAGSCTLELLPNMIGF